jgi:hypothetical protein
MSMISEKGTSFSAHNDRLEPRRIREAECLEHGLCCCLVQWICERIHLISIPRRTSVVRLYS